LPEQYRLIDAIISQIKKQVKSNRGKRPVSASLRVAEAASVTPESIIACFRRAAESDGLADVALSVQVVPLLGQCETCKTIVELDGTLCCRVCGRPYVEISDPDTVIVDSCELE
jgi:Zn finger protein HypA/HybF involved in hydrogenase expression